MGYPSNIFVISANNQPIAYCCICVVCHDVMERKQLRVRNVDIIFVRIVSILV
jgi:hypothetical protein